MNCDLLKRVCSFLTSSQSSSVVTLITGLVICYYLPIYGENPPKNENQIFHGCDITTIMSEFFFIEKAKSIFVSTAQQQNL